MTDSYHATCAELHLLNGEEPHDLSLATQVAFTIKAYYRSLDQAPGRCASDVCAGANPLLRGAGCALGRRRVRRHADGISRTGAR